MARTSPFDENTYQYEQWFEDNRYVFQSELLATRKHLPKTGRGVEIGVGSGRFALPLGIKIGVEPSERMGNVARERGIEVIDGVAENLPFADSEFDFALMMNTICFFDDTGASLREAYRILKPGGKIIIGLIDRESPLGRLYETRRENSKFYKTATFYSVDEVVDLLKNVGFGSLEFTQTIFQDLAEINNVEQTRNGYGEGGFVVISGHREERI